MAEADWFTPRISPWRAGSLRREMRACAEGVRKAKPTTANVKLTSCMASRMGKSAVLLTAR